MGHVYCYLGSMLILFGLAPKDNSTKQKELVAEAKGMGYTKVWYSPYPIDTYGGSVKKEITSRGNLR